jgi:hypothetical protein
MDCYLARFEVLTRVTVNIAAMLVVASCLLKNVLTIRRIVACRRGLEF